MRDADNLVKTIKPELMNRFLITTLKQYRLLFSLILSITLANLLVAQKTVKSQKPNIIVILADDMGYGDAGCYGQQKIATPHIDEMASQGMRFTQFYSGSAVCAPARTTLMLGRHTGHISIRGNRGMKPEGQFPLATTDTTFAMRLQKAGYTTAAFGKWSLGFIGTPGDPANKGFDDFYGYNCQTLAHNYYPDHLWSNTTRIEFPDNEKKHTNYSADLIHQQALNFLQRQTKDQPFFLYLPYTLPHADLTIPHDSVYNHYVQLFNEPALLQPAKPKDPDKIFEPYPHAAYAAMVSRLDNYVGEIIQAVRQKGIEENTLVIFLSDNGPHREDGNDPTFFNSSGGLRGIKRDLY
jgi:arylsulfatase A